MSCPIPRCICPRGVAVTERQVSRHARRVLATITIACVLLAQATSSAMRMNRTIAATVTAAERALTDSIPEAAIVERADVKVALEVPVGNFRTNERSPLPTVQLPGAPAGYALTRGTDGCWRLPGHGHCWKATR